MIVDANALNFVFALGLFDDLKSLLQICSIPLTTIDHVYRRELQDAVRTKCDELIRESILEVEQDPYSRDDFERKERKVMRKLRRFTKNHPTSRCDDQLLFLASISSLELVTCEIRLAELAEERGVRCYDLLDILDALRASDLMDDVGWKSALKQWPADVSPDTLDLFMTSENRGGPERFDCADGSEAS